MSPALNRGLRKALRTAAQVIAAGGLTAAVEAFGADLGGAGQLAVTGLWLIVVTFAQNSLETSGHIPTLLPAPGLVMSGSTTVATTQPAVADDGTVTVAVKDRKGQEVGCLTGDVIR